MRARTCYHIRNSTLAAHGGVVVLTVKPGAPEQVFDVMTAQLCPSCLGYLMGTLNGLEAEDAFAEPKP